MVVDSAPINVEVQGYPSGYCYRVVISLPAPGTQIGINEYLTVQAYEEATFINTSGQSVPLGKLYGTILHLLWDGAEIGTGAYTDGTSGLATWRFLLDGTNPKFSVGQHTIIVRSTLTTDYDSSICTSVGY